MVPLPLFDVHETVSWAVSWRGDPPLEARTAASTFNHQLDALAVEDAQASHRPLRKLTSPLLPSHLPPLSIFLLLQTYNDYLRLYSWWMILQWLVMGLTSRLGKLLRSVWWMSCCAILGILCTRVLHHFGKLCVCGAAVEFF